MRTTKNLDIECDCKIKKFLNDERFEYGLDQNKSLYIRKLGGFTWEEFHPYRLQLEKRKWNSCDIKNIL